jgi:diguanylate cyclase
MKANILDYIDFNRVDSLLEGFNKSTGFVTAILDLDGNILSKSGWREICTKYHRIHPETNKNCLISDTVLANDINNGEEYHFYECINGLVDVAIPLKINGEHIANLFTGQFLFNNPDMDFFKKQAKKYGFDQEEYLEAVRKIPVVSLAQVRTNMEFLLDITKVIIDITSDKIEKEEYQKLLGLSLESPKDTIILVINKEYNYLYFNQVHKDVMKFAYNTEIEIGDNLIESISSEVDRVNAKKNYDLALSGKAHSTIQEYGEKNIRYYESNYNPIIGENKEIIGATVFARDITRRVETERKLKASEEKYEKLFNRAPLAYQSLDINGKFVAVNQKWKELLGYLEDEVIGTSFSDFLTKDSKSLFNKNFELFKKEGSIKTEFNMIDKDNQVKTIQFDGKIDYDDNNEFSRTHCILKDVTQQRLVENSFRESEERYLLLTTEMQLGLALHEIVCDDLGNPVDYRFISVNDSFERLTGLKKEDIIGKTVLEVLPNTEKLWIEAYGKVALTGAPDKFEEYSASLGKYYQVSAFSPKRNQFAVIVDDVTERVLSVKKLEESEKRIKRSENLFQKMLNVIPDMVSIHDTDMNILYSNWNGFGEVEEKNRKIPSKCYKTYRGFDDVCPDCIAYNVIESKQPVNKEVKLAEGKWFDIRVIPIFDEDNNVESFVEWVKDISEDKRLELELAKDKETLAATLNSIGDGVIATDTFGIITGINPIATELTGWSESEALGKSFDEVFTVVYEDQSISYENPVSKALLSNSVVELANHTILVSKDNSEYFIEDTAAPIKNKSGENIGAVLVFRDVTEKKLKAKEIEYLSEHDYLTGLYNRRYFQSTYEKMVKSNNYPLGIMMIDVNGLKIINDAYGHNIGDIALKTVAKVLNQTFSKTDVVARLGGDEFVILLTDKPSLEIMQNYKELLFAKLSDIPIKKNIVISLAIGYEIANDSSKSLDEVFKLAENQMYRHKISEGVSVRNKAIRAILQTLTDKFLLEKLHSERVSKFCYKIGKAMGINNEDLKELEMAGMFHDIGKISIPDGILDKPGKLTYQEFEVIKTHTEIGYQILRAADEYSDLAIHALYHHERWDGFGYPRGLKNTDIPLFSRIICVADAYEAMTSKRPYKKAITKAKAIEELQRCSGTQFDPEIVKVFVNLLKK